MVDVARPLQRLGVLGPLRLATTLTSTTTLTSSASLTTILTTILTPTTTISGCLTDGSYRRVLEVSGVSKGSRVFGFYGGYFWDFWFVGKPLGLTEKPAI